MPRFTKLTGGRTIAVETTLPREIARLKSEGFKEQDAPTPQGSAVVKTENK